jgi:hypothetical protein
MNGTTAASIAAAVNGLTRPEIDIFKKNALVTARVLCWERESERMVAAYEAIVSKNMKAR